MDSPLFMRSGNVESSMCISCHEERSTGPIDGNHPIHKSVDYIPAELVAAGAKFGEDQTLTCQSCHTPHGAPDKRLLLVLDNMEHLFSASKELVDLLRFAPHLTLLCTSRRRLDLRSEQIYQLEGLAVPTIVDREKSIIRFKSNFNLNITAGFGIFNGIVEHVEEDIGEAFFVGPEQGEIARIGPGEVVVWGASNHLSSDIAQNRANGQRAKTQRHPARFESGDVKNAFDQRG